METGGKPMSEEIKTNVSQTGTETDAGGEKQVLDLLEETENFIQNTEKAIEQADAAVNEEKEKTETESTDQEQETEEKLDLTTAEAVADHLEEVAKREEEKLNSNQSLAESDTSDTEGGGSGNSSTDVETPQTSEDRETDVSEEQIQAGEEAMEILDEEVDPEDPQAAEKFAEYRQKLVQLLKDHYHFDQLNTEQKQALLEKVSNLTIEELEKQNLQALAEQLGIEPQGMFDFKNMALAALLKNHARNKDGTLDLDKVEKVNKAYSKWLKAREIADAPIGAYNNAKSWFVFIFEQFMQHVVEERV